MDVLLKGLNYSLGIATPRECPAKLEHAFKSPEFAEETRSESRQFTVLAILRNLVPDDLSNVGHTTGDTLKKDDNTITLSADKGRTTVVVVKTSFIHKAK